jgi:hypothetical protein
MDISFTQKEFSFLQSYLNEMFQSDNLRSGPMGGMIQTLRTKFLVLGSVNITDSEKGFLLFSLNEMFTTSRSAIVQSQLGSTMKFLRPDTEPKTISQINQNPSNLSGTYDTEWGIMTSVIAKLGKANPPEYVPLKQGPDGDPGGISTPTRHDIRDGTGYNNT